MFACYSICYSHAELRQHSPQNRSTSQTQGPEYMVWAFKEIISRDVRVTKVKEFDSEKHYLVTLDLWSQ